MAGTTTNSLLEETHDGMNTNRTENRDSANTIKVIGLEATSQYNDATSPSNMGDPQQFLYVGEAETMSVTDQNSHTMSK